MEREETEQEKDEDQNRKKERRGALMFAGQIASHEQEREQST